MFKKALSLLLSLMLLVTSLSAAAISTFAADAATYVVAGTENLCGIAWNGSPESTECIMTAKDDGTYEKVFAAVAPTTDVQFKVVENAADGTQTWIGDSTDNNITFDVTVECDVTVTFNPETKEITVTGDGVEFKTELVIDAMYAVGNAADEEDAWLNGVTWTPDAEVNKMTEVAENVYEITFDNVEGPFDAYQVKFAANGTWADSWGGVYTESGVAFDAEYNGDNLVVVVDYELADVKLTLDLNGFDYATKTGGKITIDVTEAGAVATEATTEEPTEATTEAPTEATEAPAKALTVKSTSNLFAETVQSFDADTKQVTVTYFFEAQKDVLNAQWSLKYDPAVLKVTPKNNLNGNAAPSYMPVIGVNGAVYNILAVEDMKEVNGNASSLSLYPFKDGRKAFVSVTFDVIGEGETTVDLKVDVLTLGELDEDTFQADVNKQHKVVADGKIVDAGYAMINNFETVIYGGLYNPEAEMPETVATEATTTKATEATTTEATEPTTEATEPTTTEATEPTTEEVTEPTTEEATTVAPGFAVTGTSNFFPKTTQSFNAGTKQVTVTYFIESQKDVLNAQWTLKYDPAVLQVVPKNNLNGNSAPSYMPVCGTNGAVYNIIPAANEVNGNASSLSLYPFKDGRKAFVSVTFDVLKEEDTTVDLNVMVLTLGEIDEDTFQADINKQHKVVTDGVIVEAGNAFINNVETVVYAGLFNPEAVMPEEEETTEATEATTTEATEATTTEATEPTTTEATEATTTEATEPTTEATTTAPSMDLTVVGTSNFFPESKQVIAETEKNVTVTYYFESAKALLNAQWELTYDPAVLTLNAENNKNVMPVIESGLVTNFATAGKGYGNCSNLGLYNFDAKAPFVTVVFDKADGATGETTVDLQVVAMTLSQLNPTTGESDEAAEETIVKNGSIYSTATEYSTETVVTPGIVVPEVPTEPTTVATEPTTEATEPTTEATEPRPTLPGPDDSKFFVVAGDEGLCGSAWNPADRDNEMKFNTATGLYEKIYLDVAANTYNFKVTTNGAWDNGDFNLEGDAMFGGPNATVTVPEDGSVVIISFNGQRAFVDVYGPGVEFPTFPEEPTTVPTEPTTVVTEPTTVATEPTTVATEPTTVATEPTTEATVPTETVPATTQDATTATDATSATGATVDGGSTADTPNGGNGSANGGAVQTGNASMAVIILLVLISATGVIYFTRKRAR